MRQVYDLLNRQFVNSLGSGQVMGDPTFRFTRRDTAALEPQFFKPKDDGTSSVEQLALAFELNFVAKRTGNWAGPAVVFEPNFAWLPTEGAYRGFPSFDTDELTAVFVKASGVNRFSEAHALATADIGRLVSIDSETEVNVTVPLGLGSTNTDVIYLMAVDAPITVVPASETVVITHAADVPLTTEGVTLLKLARTGVNAWTATHPDEEESVTLMGELTWRDLTKPGWTSTIKFKVVVDNDVARGNEAAPQNPGAVTQYVKKEDLEVGFVRTDVVQALPDEQKARARDNIGAVSGGDMVLTTAQGLSGPQKIAARGNIEAASQGDMNAQIASLAALATTVGGKASLLQLTALQYALTVLDNLALKKAVQVISPEDQAIILANIGAQPAAGASAVPRLAAEYNPVGNNTTTVHLFGALAANTGTITARDVTAFDAGHTISGQSGSTLTSAAHGGTDGQACRFTATGWPAGDLNAGEIFYARDTALNTFGVSRTLGGPAVTGLGGGGTSFKVYFAVSNWNHQRRIGFVSTAGVGKSCGTRHNRLQWDVSADPALGLWTFSARFGNSDAAAVANARLFVGLTAVLNAGVLPNANPSASLNLVGLGADSGDTNLSIIHNNGEGVATKVDLGVNFPANTRRVDIYDLLLTCNPDLTITYKVVRINTGDVATGNLGGNLPQPLQLLAPQIWRNTGSTSGTVAIDVMQWRMASSK